MDCSDGAQYCECAEFHWTALLKIVKTVNSMYILTIIYAQKPIMQTTTQLSDWNENWVYFWVLCWNKILPWLSLFLVPLVTPYTSVQE